MTGTGSFSNCATAEGTLDGDFVTFGSPVEDDGEYDLVFGDYRSELGAGTVLIEATYGPNTDFGGSVFDIAEYREQTDDARLVLQGRGGFAVGEGGVDEVTFTAWLLALRLSTALSWTANPHSVVGPTESEALRAAEQAVNGYVDEGGRRHGFYADYDMEIGGAGFGGSASAPLSLTVSASGIDTAVEDATRITEGTLEVTAPDGSSVLVETTGPDDMAALTRTDSAGTVIRDSVSWSELYP